MLIEVEEREIKNPRFFETLKDAQVHMGTRLLEVPDINNGGPENVKDILGILEAEELDAVFEDYEAYCSVYGNNFDWKIINIANLLVIE